MVLNPATFCADSNNREAVQTELNTCNKDATCKDLVTWANSQNMTEQNIIDARYTDGCQFSGYTAPAAAPTEGSGLLDRLSSGRSSFQFDINGTPATFNVAGAGSSPQDGYGIRGAYRYSLGSITAFGAIDLVRYSQKEDVDGVVTTDSTIGGDVLVGADAELRLGRFGLGVEAGVKYFISGPSDIGDFESDGGGEWFTSKSSFGIFGGVMASYAIEDNIAIVLGAESTYLPWPTYKDTYTIQTEDYTVRGGFRYYF